MTNQTSINQLSHIERWISELKIKSVHVLVYLFLLFVGVAVLRSAGLAESTLVTRFALQLFVARVINLITG